MLNTVGGVLLEGCDCCCDCTYLRTAGPYTQPPSPTPFVKRSPIEGEIISPTTRNRISPLPPSTVTHCPIRVWSLLHGVRGQHDLVVGARRVSGYDRWVDVSLQWVEGEKKVDEMPVDRGSALAGAGEDGDSGVGRHVRILGEEGAIFCLFVVKIVGIAHEHVPVPTLLTWAGDEIVET